MYCVAVSNAVDIVVELGRSLHTHCNKTQGSWSRTYTVTPGRTLTRARPGARPLQGSVRQLAWTRIPESPVQGAWVSRVAGTKSLSTGRTWNVAHSDFTPAAAAQLELPRLLNNGRFDRDDVHECLIKNINNNRYLILFMTGGRTGQTKPPKIRFKHELEATDPTS